MEYGHAQAPSNPSDGDRFTCPCGATFEYVELLGGYAEWVEIHCQPEVDTESPVPGPPER